MVISFDTSATLNDETLRTYRLKSVLIIDDEATSVSRPLHDSAMIMAFSIQHYSELLLREKREC